MRSVAIIAGLLCLSVQLAGCSGSVPNSLPNAHIAGPDKRSTGLGIAQFRITIPRAAQAARSHFVSPSSQSMTLQLKYRPRGKTFLKRTFTLSSSTKGCVQTTLQLSCAFAVKLQQGHYFAAVATFDGPTGTGNVVSSEQYVRLHVLSKRMTNVGLVLGGVPRTLTVAGAGDAVQGSQRAGLTLFGTAAENVIVSSLDADGNQIVGAGSPRYSLSRLSGSGWTVQATPNPATPNLFSVAPPGKNGAGAIVNITAYVPHGACSQPGAICRATFSVVNHLQTLFVGGACSSVCSSQILAYTAPYTGTPAVVDTPQGVITSMVVDKNGNLFVAVCKGTCGTAKGPDAVFEYAPPYNAGPAQTITTNIYYPQFVTVDAAGNLYVDNHTDYKYGATGGDSVTAYAPFSGQFLSTGKLNSGSIPTMIVDSSGNVFYTLCAQGSLPCGGSSLSMLQPPTYGTPVAVANSPSTATYTGMAFDAAGDLFVAAGPSVVEYAPPFAGAASPVAAITAGIGNATSVVLDPDANLFVANSDGAANAVSEYEPPYTGAPISVSTRRRSSAHAAPTGPVMLLLGRANELFVLNGGGTVSVSAPPYTTSTALAPQFASASAFAIAP